MTGTDLVLYVSLETQSDIIKRKNLFFVNMFLAFVSIIFNFSAIYFFTFILKSITLVGIFLGLGNLVAFAVDIPVGVLQKYFKAKILLLISCSFMFCVGLIFFYFLSVSSDSSGGSSGDISMLFNMFISNPINVLLLIISTILYGFIQELNSVTILSYILNNADPSEYSNIMSRNNIFGGVGCLIGLVASGIIFSLSNYYSILLFLFLVLVLASFIFKYFDNNNISVDFSGISKLKVITKKENVEKMKEYVTAQIKKTDFAEIAKKGTKYLFLKPLEVKSNTKIDFKELKEITKKEFKIAYSVIFGNPRKFIIFWSIMSIFLFGFWDTFAATFLIDFLKKFEINDGFFVLSAYIILGLIAIPAFITPEFFIAISKKIGTLPIILFGILISGVSMLFFGFASSFFMLIMFGVMNSIGYGAAMVLSQEIFLTSYNNHYAEKQNLTEIDSNVSAAPLKMLGNLGNVVGLTTGGFLVGTIGYTGFFIVFALALLGFFVFTIAKKKEIEV
ncbi:MAG: MFS transporter [Candidatus Gracilibacteria bacterium]|nr:MFS transporter [Candidatus Gracilibacteria bacterium]